VAEVATEARGTTRILDGVGVVELTDFVAGPFAGRILADLGADVVKLELPRGDSGRRSGPFAHGHPHREGAAVFLQYNRNKRGLRVDLSTQGGRRILHNLLDEADVFLSDLTPAEQEHYELRSASVRDGRPQLIVASVTPYGQSGPAADLPSTPLTRMHSAGTAHTLVRGLGAGLGRPIATGGYVNEADGGTACAIGIIAALIARGEQESGDGQIVEVSVQEAMSALDRVDLSISRNDQALSRRSMGSGFGGRWECADGYLVAAMPQPHQWAGLVKTMGNPDWAYDADGELLDRSEHGAALNEKMQEWSSTRTREEIYHAAQANSAPIGAVFRPSEVMTSKQEEARDFFAMGDHAWAGELPYTQISALFSGTDGPPTGVAPLLGEANCELLAERLGGWAAATARRAGVA
jgi:crotonobetainyl-CoA:carnitine CoA-transferase CaiB-like acyl-CoA transferase